MALCISHNGYILLNQNGQNLCKTLRTEVESETEQLKAINSLVEETLPFGRN